MKTLVLLLLAALCYGSSPGFAAEWSWDPLKDAENVLPEGVPNEGKIIQARHQVREMAQDALATLYEVQPGARRAIERSAGYAVFSTFGIKLFFAGGTTGKGVVVNRQTNRQTFMQMAQVQGGLGFGVNKNRLIFVFANQQALAQLRQSGLGNRRPDQRFGDGRWPGRHVQRGNFGGTRGLPVPTDRYRALGDPHRVRDQILQGFQSQLSDCVVSPGQLVRGPLSFSARRLPRCSNLKERFER